MTKLSVNINKIATIRNARAGDVPNLVKAAIDIESFGAEGITVHPRPDERHIRYDDVYQLKEVLTTEFNIEGNPIQKFEDMVLEVIPDQVTLVPDSPEVLTSNAGWNTIEHQDFLREKVSLFKEKGIRTSIFIDPIPEMIEAAATTGVDRIELYTEDYAREYHKSPTEAISNYLLAAQVANSCDLGINAGHDLDLKNLKYFKQNINQLLEVSIGHALISDALYYGLDNTVKMYLSELRD